MSSEIPMFREESNLEVKTWVSEALSTNRYTGVDHTYRQGWRSHSTDRCGVTEQAAVEATN
jgi:hypothetical protein